MHSEAEIEGISVRADAKIASWRKGSRTVFWYAASSDGIDPAQANAAGFDNYPLAPADHRERIFFFERLLGCEQTVIDGQAGSFFHTWCRPRITLAEDIRRLRVDLDQVPAWSAFCAGLRDRCASSGLPALGLAFSPLDWACSLCGVERLFCFLYDAPEEVERLFDFLADLFIETQERLRRVCLRTLSGQGFQAIWVSDLHLAFLPPSVAERFILPCYRRVAEACGGALISLQVSDVDLLARFLANDAILGGAFDRRLALADIRQVVGKKLFVIHHYCYDPAFDRPTCRDGMYWNPTVQTWSREVGRVYDTLAGDCSMIIHLERPRFAEVCEVKAQLLAGTYRDR